MSAASAALMAAAVASGSHHPSQQSECGGSPSIGQQQHHHQLHHHHPQHHQQQHHHQLQARHRQKSLLTSALGSGTAPVHPFLSANSAASADTNASGHSNSGYMLSQVLDTWDRVWMGSPQTPSAGVSPSSPTSTSPSQPPTVAPPGKPQSPTTISTTANGITTITTVRLQGAPTPSAPVSVVHASQSTAAANGAAAAAASISSSSILRSTPVPNFPATPPPAHRPLTMAHLSSATSTPAATATATAAAARGATMPVPTPPPYKALGGAAAAAAAAQTLAMCVAMPLSRSPSSASAHLALLDRPSPDNGSSNSGVSGGGGVLCGMPHDAASAAVLSAHRHMPHTGQAGGLLLAQHRLQQQQAAGMVGGLGVLPDAVTAAIGGPLAAAKAAATAAGNSGASGAPAGGGGKPASGHAIAAAVAAAPGAIPIFGTSHRSSTGALSALHDAQGVHVTSTGRAVQPHHPALPRNAKDSTDFASVFFSPLPYSYLNMACSDSTDQMLVNSVGSPDMTLRNGRPTASSSLSHVVEWSADVDLAAEVGGMAQQDGCGGAGGGGAGGARDGAEAVSTSGEDALLLSGSSVGSQATAVGSPAAAGRVGIAAGAPTSVGLSLVQQALRQQQQQDDATRAMMGLANRTPTSSGGGAATACGGGAAANGHQHQVHASAAVQIAADNAKHAAAAISIVGRSISAASSMSPTSGGLLGSCGHQHANGHGAAAADSCQGGGRAAAAGRRRPGPLPRPGDALGVAHFSAIHGAVGGLAAALPGMPIVPGTDLLQATGYGSIASALETQSQQAPPLRLVAGAAMIPHVDKADKGGEDAYCIVHAGLGAIGVADGVSGWAEEGIDPADYSRSLIRYCSEALQEAGSSADAREVIRYAHRSTVMPGSSTVCLALMKPAGKLQVANLGDSGVRIIRDGHIVFASSAQQHMFNMPYQLSHPSIIDSPDDADSADVMSVDVLPGDVIVMATDGLYDNMFDEEIAAICYEVISSKRRALLLAGMNGDVPPTPEQAAAAAAAADRQIFTALEAEALALRISRQAHRYAQNPYQRTPWSVASCEQGYQWARYFAKGGGKMDDCTVIVSFVQPDTAAAAAKAAVTAPTALPSSKS